MKRIVFSTLILSLFTLPLRGQDAWNHFTAAAGGGISFPVGPIKAHTKTGFNFYASGGPRFNSRLALTLDFSLHYSELHNSFESPQNNVTLSKGSLLRVWSLTVDPEYTFIKRERFSTYASGGYGLYNRKLLLAAPGLAPVNVCDPFWNVCVKNETGVTITGNESVNKGGYNVGGGMTFGTRHKFFAEARYHHMFTAGSATEIIPLTFGVRW